MSSIVRSLLWSSTPSEGKGARRTGLAGIISSSIESLFSSPRREVVDDDDDQENGSVAEKTPKEDSNDDEDMHGAAAALLSLGSSGKSPPQQQQQSSPKRVMLVRKGEVEQVVPVVVLPPMQDQRPHTSKAENTPSRKSSRIQERSPYAGRLGDDDFLTGEAFDKALGGAKKTGSGVDEKKPSLLEQAPSSLPLHDQQRPVDGTTPARKSTRIQERPPYKGRLGDVDFFTGEAFDKAFGGAKKTSKGEETKLSLIVQASERLNDQQLLADKTTPSRKSTRIHERSPYAGRLGDPFDKALGGAKKTNRDKATKISPKDLVPATLHNQERPASEATPARKSTRIQERSPYAGRLGEDDFFTGEAFDKALGGSKKTKSVGSTEMADAPIESSTADKETGERNLNESSRKSNRIRERTPYVGRLGSEDFYTGEGFEEALALGAKKSKTIEKSLNEAVASKPKNAKAPWTKEEDECLQNLFQTLVFEQIRPWDDVAAYMSGRDGYECCKRWYDCLSSGIPKNQGNQSLNWPPKEQELLMKVIEVHGSPDYDKLVASYFPHRTPGSLKSCWFRISQEVSGTREKNCARKGSALSEENKNYTVPANASQKAKAKSPAVARRSKPQEWTREVCLAAAYALLAPFVVSNISYFTLLLKDDERLQSFVQTLIFEQMRAWRDVAASMNGYTGDECCRRWYDTLHPAGFQSTGRPNAWHQKEKHLLEKVVIANGPTFDKLASNYFPHRNAKSLERCWIRIKSRNDIEKGKSTSSPAVPSPIAKDQRPLQQLSQGYRTSDRARKRQPFAGRLGSKDFFTGDDFDEALGYQGSSKRTKDKTIAPKELSAEKSAASSDFTSKVSIRPVLKKRKAAADVDMQQTQKAVSFGPAISVVTIPRANKKHRAGCWTAEVRPTVKHLLYRKGISDIATQLSPRKSHVSRNLSTSLSWTNCDLGTTSLLACPAVQALNAANDGTTVSNMPPPKIGPNGTPWKTSYCLIWWPFTETRKSGVRIYRCDMFSSSQNLVLSTCTNGPDGRNWRMNTFRIGRIKLSGITGEKHERIARLTLRIRIHRLGNNT
jgi:hypothetical protein